MKRHQNNNGVLLIFFWAKGTFPILWRCQENTTGRLHAKSDFTISPMDDEIYSNSYIGAIVFAAYTTPHIGGGGGEVEGGMGGGGVGRGGGGVIVLS